MIDRFLRELERRFKETGAPEDEAQWIRLRLRAGLLKHDQVKLASYLAHPAARLVVPSPLIANSYGEDPTLPEGCTLRWLLDGGRGDGGLAQFGKMVMVRAAIAAVRYVHDPLVDRSARGSAVMRAVEAWALDPSPATRGECVREYEKSVQVGPLVPGDGPCYAAGYSEKPDGCTGWVANCRSEITSAASRAGDIDGDPDEPHLVRSLSGEETIQAAICAELIPWALGYRDPIAERHE